MLDWKRLGEYDMGHKGLVGVGDLKKFLVKKGYDGATLYIALFGIVIIGQLISSIK